MVERHPTKWKTIWKALTLLNIRDTPKIRVKNSKKSSKIKMRQPARIVLLALLY